MFDILQPYFYLIMTQHLHYVLGLGKCAALLKLRCLYLHHF